MSRPRTPLRLVAKQRLDILLVERGLCKSRQQAQRLIRAGVVQVDHVVSDKPGTLIALEAAIQVKQKAPYVSRGGDKLAKALSEFEVPIEGRVCLDGGISTGGFTDCLLQAGASRVYGIDVGYGQVAWKLRQDPRVMLKERTNLRYLTPEDLYSNGDVWPDFAVLDLSFISLTKVLSALWRLLQSPREAILLVKPQFEVGRDKVGKKGVVRNPRDQAISISQVIQAATTQGWTPQGVIWSPIQGPAGNIEYLLWLTEWVDNPCGQTDVYTSEELLELTQAAQKCLTGLS